MIYIIQFMKKYRQIYAIMEMNAMHHLNYLLFNRFLEVGATHMVLVHVLMVSVTQILLTQNVNVNVHLDGLVTLAIVK